MRKRHWKKLARMTADALNDAKAEAAAAVVALREAKALNVMQGVQIVRLERERRERLTHCWVEVVDRDGEVIRSGLASELQTVEGEPDPSRRWSSTHMNPTELTMTIKYLDSAAPYVTRTVDGQSLVLRMAVTP